MSLDAMNAVWKHSEAKGNALLTLLAISDNANDDGFAYPSYDHMAAKTRLSKRTVQNQVSELLQTDELTLISSGTQGRSNVYAVNIAHLRAKPPALGSQVAKAATSPGGNPGGKQAATLTVSIEPSEKSTVADATGSQLFETQDAPEPAQKVTQLHVEVESIWAHYVELFDPPRRELTDSRRRLIERALKECAPMEDRVDYLKSAVTGLHIWRSRRKGDTSLSAVFQTRPGGSTLGDQLQFFVDQATSGGTSASPKVPSVLSGTITARKREVIDMLAYPDSPDHKERGLAAMKWLKDEAGTEPIIESGALRGWRAVAA